MSSIQLIQQIRHLGRLPREVRGPSEEQVAERRLAERLRRARRRKQLTPEQEAELQQIGGAAQPANDAAAELQQIVGAAQPANDGDAAQLANNTAVRLMQEIRDLGKLPKEVNGDNAEQVQERKLAKRLRLARRQKQLTPE